MTDRPFRVVGAPKRKVTGPACVRARLGDLLPILASALDAQAAWLDDLADDEVIVTADLADLIRRVQLYRDPAAAA